MWKYNNEELSEVPENIVGFVYCITNQLSGKQYIGKKNFYSNRRVKVKARKNRRKVTNVSNWRDYYGSNADLLSDVESLGSCNFSREILHFCKNKAEMSYLEIKEQIEREVLFSENYYNNFIGCRIHKNHLKKNK